jgi:hypothetical protein
MTIFWLLLFANKSKTKTWKNENKNTGLFINCMDFVVVRTKINKKKSSFIFVMLGPWKSHRNLFDQVLELNYNF